MRVKVSGGHQGSDSVGSAGWSCPACGGPSQAPTKLFEPAVTFIVCRGCGLHHRVGYLGARRSYTDAYYENYPRLGGRYLADQRQRVLEAECRLAFVSRHSNPPAQGSLLEVGPGSGAFLAAARGEGWSVEAIEPAVERASELRADGFTTHICHLEDFPGGRAFRAICAWHVFEHLSDPSLASAHFRSLCGDGGWLFLELPNIASFVARVMKSKWSNLDPENHPYQYTPRAIAEVLGRSGFSPITIETVPSSIYYNRRLRRDPRRMVKRAIIGLGSNAMSRGAGTGHELLRVAARI
jgi:hypothetical protein